MTQERHYGRHITVIEDEEDILELITFILETEGYKVMGHVDGLKGLNSVKEQCPDLLILDLMLPGIEGMEICRILKNDIKYSTIPIIMVTAKGSNEDIVHGLNMGADDYITKPFSTKVFIARVASVLRRTAAVKDKEEIIQYKGLSIHPGKRRVLIDGTEIDLTNSEFQILHLFSRKQGWIFTRDQIVDIIREPGYAVTPRSIDVIIVGLRKKLNDYSNCIETIRGVGYRFIEGNDEKIEA
ncbi:MAG: response regulator transcription factor [Nitrospirae bacterium]|nr:response regulator transcription factor [Nitrospirota bacterium]